VKARAPSEIGVAAGAALPPWGRAERFTAVGGAPGELWRIPREAEAVAERLLALSAEGVGGFLEGGSDGDGVWLLRRAAPSLLERMGAVPRAWPWRDAAAIALSLARALAACEKAALSAGPLAPETVRLDGAAFLAADALVAALLGDTQSAARTPGIAAAHTPPDQRAGARWDAAANRFALGMLLYSLLGGSLAQGGGAEHPALGAHLDDVAPLPEAVAATLPAGLHSLVLRMLDADPARRPGRAADIAAEMAAFLGDATRTQQSPGQSRREPEPRRRARRTGGEAPDPVAERTRAVRAAQVAAVRGARPTWRTLGARFWPVLAGVAVAAGALALLAPPRSQAALASIAASPPLTDRETTAEDCASCHTRQAAEWRRSVMAHSVKSPLFNSLESLIQEQVGRDAECPNGAGILRKANQATACRDRLSGRPVTGSGGEHWCVNCHSPGENLAAVMPAWDGRAGGDRRSRHPVRDLLGERQMEGISCAFCHQVHGPVGGRGAPGYQGNATWTSFTTGAVFAARPEDGRGLFGIANSGYDLRPETLLLRGARSVVDASGDAPLAAHGRPSAATRAYLASSEFCGSCHDVRLFGTDSLGGARGEHFKRLRNAYSEWASWAASEKRAGREAASCQGCHMSTYPGVCERIDGAPITAPERVVDGPRRPGAARPSEECPPGFRFVARAPGAFPQARMADNSAVPRAATTHWFSGVDVPLSREFPDALVDEDTVDANGIPLSARRRRDTLLKHTFRFDVGAPRRAGNTLEVPIEIENTGAGHRVPAGFSQEREFWVHLTVTDGDGRVVYEVGRVNADDQDLPDKVFTRIGMDLDRLDRFGRPEGVFGADVRDGPDHPQWSPSPLLGGSTFRGRGLINFQNGFLRCVRCVGTIDAAGRCQPLPGQEQHRADRFVDGDYDTDTGECRSNLSGLEAFLEVYFPVGALDASRGLVKGPDAIVDTRSAPPGVPLRYTYELPVGGRRGPFRVEARLNFRAFPPFLVRGHILYERAMAARGARPSGPLVDEAMMRRLEIVELARDAAEVR
jgi:hypothetical protein